MSASLLKRCKRRLARLLGRALTRRLRIFRTPLSMQVREEHHPLAGFYPDARARSQLHYAFAQRFLPGYAHENPFNFVHHDGVDPSRFIHARWQMFEKMAGPQTMSSPMTQPTVFRRITDLAAWAQVVAERPALFVEMPLPEAAACAFFIAVVLLAPAGPFITAQAAIQSYIANSGPAPDESLLAPLRRAPCRYFTLERALCLEGPHVLQHGHFCEWTREGEHRSSGAFLPVTREAFADAVACALAQGDAVPAVASSNPQQNVIRINPPPQPSNLPA